jgi:hypothetical protein
MSCPSEGCSDVRWKYVMAGHWAEAHAEQAVPSKITRGARRTERCEGQVVPCPLIAQLCVTYVPGPAPVALLCKTCSWHQPDTDRLAHATGSPPAPSRHPKHRYYAQSKGFLGGKGGGGDRGRSPEFHRGFRKIFDPPPWHNASLDARTMPLSKPRKRKKACRQSLKDR